MNGSGGRGGGPTKSAKDAALRMLSVRALTVREVRERLGRKGFAAEDVEPAVASLLERGYLDDRALAYNVAASRASRLFGPARVAAELKRRGIAAEAVSEAVRRVFDEVDEDELAESAAAKIAGPRRPPSGGAGGARLARALLRRGFSRGAVAKALGNRGSSEWEEGSSRNDETELETDP